MADLPAERLTLRVGDASIAYQSIIRFRYILLATLNVAQLQRHEKILFDEFRGMVMG
jgi:hypothetical protein